ncbi:hypothetical protein LTR86_000071 [Recurvomyces mirabilis]|nr:hypothetical protein LTR86_000071 [Recurvomyces mirabilis]
MTAFDTSPDPADWEKHTKAGEETVHEAADRGHAATDRYGNALVHFDPAAERKLRWKIDLCIIPTVSLVYLFAFIDRANIAQRLWCDIIDKPNPPNANIGQDYNIILSTFYVSYIIFEIPANMLCKKLGPGWFIPTITLLFGICSFGTAFVKTRAQACGVRFLLGIFEAGMLPGVWIFRSFHRGVNRADASTDRLLPEPLVSQE